MSVTISGSGQIVKQVIQVVKTDTFTTTSSSFVDVTGLSINITPTNSANKILVICDIACSNATGSGAVATFLRNGSVIYGGDVAGSRPNGLAEFESANTLLRTGGIFLDSPATTSSVTYKIQLLNSIGSSSYVNRTGRDNNGSSYDPRAASSITVMEIAYA